MTGGCYATCVLTRAGFGYGSGVIVDTVVGLEEVMILGEEGSEGVREKEF